MTTARPKTGVSADDPGQKKPIRDSSASAPSSPDAGADEKALAELLSKGAEEIQDHLSLVARIQVQIGRFLETSIEELERAQRLETLTSLIAGSDAEKDRAGGGPDSFSRRPEDRPTAFLEHEIKTLKKMQKLLGIREHTEREDTLAAIDVPGTLASEEEEQESAWPRKVLVIFHDPGTVRILRYFLEKEDFDVAVCTNGPDGLKKAAQEKPDIILLDILLPGMDGYQVLGRLKKDAVTSRIPVFVLSVISQEADILKAIEGGAAEYFVKPFSPPIIIAKIRRALKARHE
jgi:CheY-like chemotaxis protein